MDNKLITEIITQLSMQHHFICDLVEASNTLTGEARFIDVIAGFNRRNVAIVNQLLELAEPQEGNPDV